MEENDNLIKKESKSNENFKDNNNTDSSKTKSILDDNNITYENRLEVPKIEKSNGDKFLKENNFEMALKHYSKVGLAIKILVDEKAAPNNELQKLVDEYGIPTSLNLSFIYYKQKNWELAIKHCKIVIDAQPTNLKAYYRKTMCLINLGKLQEIPEMIDKLVSLGLKEDSKEMTHLLEAFENEKQKSKNQRVNFYNKALKGYFKNNKTNVSYFGRITNFLTNLYSTILSTCCKKKIK